MNRIKTGIMLASLLASGSIDAVLAQTTYGQPYIAGFSPASGPAGTVITLTGSGFTGNNAAWIGSGHDAAYAVLSDSRMTVTVPNDGTSGQIALFNPQHAAWSGSSFAVTASSGTTAGSSTGAARTAAAAPTVILKTSATVLTPGQSIALTWSSANATKCSGVSTQRSGSKTIAPATTTTYTETCSNSAGSRAASVTVTVNAPVQTPAPASAPTPSPSPSPTLSVRVSGNHFIDGMGRTLQLRGVNLSALEFVAVGGWSPANPWGGQTGTATPNWATIKSWGTNAVRIPLNEASWLAVTCTDTSGNLLRADPGSNYQSTVLQAVKDATAAGLYVILDLHWTAPGGTCPLLQTQMADSDHSLTFWGQVASAYKAYPNVLFELFNEPFFNFEFSGNVWPYLMLGSSGNFTGYPATSSAGKWQDLKASWSIASMQSMLTAVRAAGATNVVLIGSDGYSQDLSGWVATHPNDPLGQMAATWHAYPTYDAVLGSAADALPNFGTQAYAWAQNILAAGFPVVITEFGGHNTPGTVGAPMAQTLLEWADPRNVSYFGWTWDTWGINDNDLIKDGTGTPTDGFGVYVKSHYLCAATGSTNCP